MSKLNLLLKTTLVAVFAIYASMNLNAGTITIVPDAATTGAAGTGYASATFTAQEVGWTINNWIPNTLQVRGNNGTVSNNFQFYNTTAIPGGITKVTLNTLSGNTTVDTGSNRINSASVSLVSGADVQTGTTTGVGSTPGTDCVYWELSGDNNFFRIQFVNGATSGTARISSIVIEYSESVVNQVKTPTFDPAEGTYTTPQSVTLATATDGASIYYTTDGSDPTASSTLYTAPITVSTTTTIKAIAIKAGMDNSGIATATYTFQEVPSQVEAPIFSPVAGFYTASQDVTISTQTDGASIYYTTNGSDPTASSTLYTAPITVSTATTIKAIAIKDGMDNSDVAAATYTFPEIAEGEGIVYQTGFESSEGFTASTTYNNPAMAFTGTADSQWGTIYGTPSTTSPISGAQSMQMRWYTNATTTFGSAETRFDLPNVTKVTFKAKNTVATNGQDVTVLYSTDEGATWTGGKVFKLGTNAASFLYNISATGEFANVRIKFLVTQSGDAPTGTVQVTIDDVAVYGMAGEEPAQVATPVFSPAGGFYSEPQDVTISTATDGASIYYTTDGSDPTASSTLYSAPITVSATTTIKAIAIKEGMIDSGIAAVTYTLPEIADGEEIIYQTGFESSEGFTASTVYNNTAMAFTGPEGAQWGTIYGTPTTTSPISGAQSMQMRWYTSAATTFGSTETRFDLPNVTKVTFKAKNTVSTNGQDVTVLYSTDGGTSWTGGEVFTLGTNAASFIYNISATGEYANVRIKFLVTQSGNAPAGTVQVTIDDVAVYGITGLEPTQVAAPAFSPSGGLYTAPQSVSITTETEGASIYYTTDGANPTASSTLYTEPITVSATTTIKAIAIKEGMDNSSIATITYTFPVEVADIAEFNALPNNTVAKITGAITVAYQNGNNLFVQDASGWLLIYGSTTKTYQNGDQLTGVIGTFLMFGTPAYPELTPVAGIELPDGVVGAPVIPAALAPADLTNADLNRYVSLSDVEIAADVTYTGATGVSGTIINGDGTMIIRDYWGLIKNTFSQGDKVNVTGFVRYASSAIMIYALSIDSYTGINNPQLAAANVYAENGVICINNLQGTAKINVYDLSGKLIFQTTTATATKIPVAKGVYVVKVGTQAFKVVNK